MINTKDLVLAVVKKSGVENAIVEHVVNILVEEMIIKIATSGQMVRIDGFCTFGAKYTRRKDMQKFNGETYSLGAKVTLVVKKQSTRMSLLLNKYT